MGISRHVGFSVHFVVSLVAKSCLILCDTVDCSPPGFSVYGIFQARILEWAAIFLLQGIFSTKLSNVRLLCLLHCRQILHPLSHRGSILLGESKEELSRASCSKDSVIFTIPFPMLAPSRFLESLLSSRTTESRVFPAINPHPINQSSWDQQQATVSLPRDWGSPPVSRHFICSIRVTTGETTRVRGGGPTEPKSDLSYVGTHMGRAPQSLIEVFSCRPLLLQFPHTQENRPQRLQDNCLPAASTPQLSLSVTHTVSIHPHFFSFFRKHSRDGPAGLVWPLCPWLTQLQPTGYRAFSPQLRRFVKILAQRIRAATKLSTRVKQNVEIKGIPCSSEEKSSKDRTHPTLRHQDSPQGARSPYHYLLASGSKAEL